MWYVAGAVILKERKYQIMNLAYYLMVEWSVIYYGVQMSYM